MDVMSESEQSHKMRSPVNLGGVSQKDRILGVKEEVPIATSTSTNFKPSISVSAVDPKDPVGSASADKEGLCDLDHRPVVRFGNILDGCASCESAVEEETLVRPKPVHIEVANGPEVDSNRCSSQTVGTNGIHFHSTSSTTVPEFVQEVKEHLYSSSVTKGTPSAISTCAESQETRYKLSPSSSSSSPPIVDAHSPNSLEGSHSPHISKLDPRSGEGAGEVSRLKHFLFPVSNSPVDIVTILTRLASFTGVLLQVSIVVTL